MKITIVTKLKIRHSKYNDWSRGAAKQTNKQTSRLRDKKTDQYLHKKTYWRNKKTYLQTDAQADLLWTNAQRELNK